VHLDLRVDLLNSLGLLNRLGRGGEFLGIIVIDRQVETSITNSRTSAAYMGLARGAERGCLISIWELGGCSHDFTIQLGTCLGNRTEPLSVRDDI